MTEPGPQAARRRSPERTVALLTLALTATAAVVTLSLDQEPMVRFGPAPWAPVVAAVAGFLVMERLVFHVEYRRQSMSLSLAEVPLAFALAFLPPWLAITTRIVGSLCAHLLSRRPTPLKLAFNASVFATETAIAMLVVRTIAGSGTHHGALMIGVIAAVIISSITGGTLVTIAVTAFEGGLRRRLAAELRTGWVIYLMGAFAGGLSVAPALVDWRLVALPAAPVIGLWRLMAARGVLAQRYRDLDELHAFTSHIGRSLDLDEVVPRACAEVQRLLRAEHAALVVFDPDTGAAIARTAVGTLTGLPADRRDAGWGAALTEPGVCTVTTSDPHLARWLATCALDEALVVPVHDDDGLLAVLVLAGRTAATTQFTTDDRHRLEPLTAQLALALRKLLLHHAIEHQATHDRLTGLPSRAALEAALDDALATTGTTSVMMLDLDGFKEINDVLGHHTGDAVLREFAQRVTAVIGQRGLLSRFAGDEFAVVAPAQDRHQIADVARDILDELRRPFDIGDLAVAVACSIGTATAPDDGTGGADLLRRADLAMYEAKGRSSGFEAFHRDMEVDSADRLAMLAELRAALDSSEIHVHFQPKIDLATGTVIGAEALVRWQHPRHGLLAADRFIGLAERTDLIHHLSDIVLDQSLDAVGHWRRHGLDLGVAVNYSARSLFDELLADRIAHQLERHQIPADRLTIEVTESSIMTDVDRAAATLQRLRDLGVGISVDDYGTGHSSLAYLRRLPVTELKIDRAFVTNLLIEPDDEIIVRSTIDLARNLGLHVVAEGIESAPIADRLYTLGCQTGQGYGFSRPLPLPKFDAWLTATHRMSTHLG